MRERGRACVIVHSCVRYRVCVRVRVRVCALILQYACVRVIECKCVRACVRACVRVCVRMRAWVLITCALARFSARARVYVRACVRFTLVKVCACVCVGELVCMCLHECERMLRLRAQM